MMTVTKKNYASLQAVQEGNMVPENKQLDIKGIECLTKSSKSESTRQALSKILLEDIMKVPVIDQLKFIKDIAIFQKRIINSVESGSKEYFKPATVKAMNSYDNPMSQQGIKASVVWNGMKSSDYQALNLEERNAIDIAKVNINKANVCKIQETFPEVYENCLNLLDDPNFKNGIDCIGIPIDTPTPDWIMDFIDYQEIVDNNIGGFPYESIGIKQINKNNVNWTNIVEL